MSVLHMYVYFCGKMKKRERGILAVEHNHAQIYIVCMHSVYLDILYNTYMSNSELFIYQ